MTAVVSEMGQSLRGYWARALPPQRAAYLVSVALILIGLAHGLAWLIVGGPVDGPLSWRKPVTFGISFGVTTATLAWVSQFLSLSERSLRRTLVALMVANTVEVVVISVQRARGIPSHFNLSNILDGTLWVTIGVAIIVTMVVIGVYTVRAFTASTAPPSMTLALRVGLLILAVSMALGVWMVVRGSPPEALPDPVRVGESGSIKLAHAVGMHGIQTLAVLAWLASFTALDETRRVRLVALGAVGYSLATVTTIVLTVLGAAPLTTGLVGLLTEVVAVGCLAAAGVAVLLALVTRRAPATPDRTGSPPEPVLTDTT